MLRYDDIAFCASLFMFRRAVPRDMRQDAALFLVMPHCHDAHCAAEADALTIWFYAADLVASRSAVI